MLPAPLTRTLCTGILVLVTSGCYAWQNVSLVENADPESRPKEIEVLRKGGHVEMVHYPWIERDSLHGYSNGKRETRVGFALSDIERARTQGYSSGRTALGIGVGIAALVGLWLLLISGSGGIAPSA